MRFVGQAWSLTISLEQKWNKAFGLFHIVLIRGPEKLAAFTLIRGGSGKQKGSRNQCQGSARQTRRLEKNAPGQQQQRTVKRVTDVSVYSSSDHCGGLFEGQQAGIAGALFGRLAAPVQGAYTEKQWHEARKQENPCDELIPGEWVNEPKINVEEEKDQDAFPGEETVKTMRARLA